MDEWVINLINNCAFPIAMCVCMFRYMTTQGKETNDSVNKLCAKLTYYSIEKISKSNKKKGGSSALFSYE